MTHTMASDGKTIAAIALQLRALYDNYTKHLGMMFDIMLSPV